MVTTVKNDPTTGLPVTQTSSGSAVKDQEDRFLKLLVTQMKNQDPLNPLDNAQVTSQMAQLSTVTGIEKLNATLQTMSQSQTYQAATLINHGVLAPGAFIDLSTSNGVSTAVAGIDLPKAADKVTVKIFDSSNQLVRTIEGGKQDAGSNLFSWDGKNDDGTAVADGSYHFTVQATKDGESVEPISLSVGMVNSVLMDASGPKLVVGGMGKIDMATVRQIL